MPVFLHVLSPAEVDRFYPLDAREQELEATVLLRLTIDAEGRVVEAVPLDDPGNGFAEAARQRMLRERFVPGRVNGRPVPTEIQFKVRFERED
jgi:TonB family protein